MTALQKASRIQQIINEVQRQAGINLQKCLPIDVDLVIGRFGRGSSVANMVTEYGKLTGRW